MSDHENPNQYVTASVELAISGHSLRIQMTVPTAPTPPVKLLPLFQSLADVVVGMASKDAERAGLAISCRKGCGACCRQLVPISAIEARRIRKLVDELPDPRRSEILARFSAARRRLEDAGLLERLLHSERIAKADGESLGLEYFDLGIACPFLEEESCSIHSDRPISCREYLVTSPAEHCARPTADTIECVKIPAKVSNVVMRIDQHSNAPRSLWVPLILAPEWAGAHPDEAPLRPGTELVREAFSRLTGKDVGDTIV